MNETIKNEEALKEVNPVDEYLKNYKEQKLAEFCAQKDKEIENRKEERQKLMEQISDMKDKAQKHDEIWKDIDKLYDEIKKMPVDDFLKLYHKICNDISGNRSSTTTTIFPNGIDIRGNW
jgi:DNA repair exonuclease SbcCD ATPase subunit